MILSRQQRDDGLAIDQAEDGIRDSSTSRGLGDVYKRQLFFRSFSIDARYRGQGYGTATMRELPQFVKNHYPEVNELCLTVNTDNDIAQKLYQRLNYTTQGETTLEGRPVLIMSLAI